MSGADQQTRATAFETSGGTRYSIVYFSIVPWDFIHQRMHALSAEFASRGHDVYFVEPPHLKKGYKTSFNHSKLGFSFPDEVFGNEPAPRIHDIVIPRRFSFGRLKFDLHFLEYFGRVWLVKLIEEIRRRSGNRIVLIFSSPIFSEVATRARCDFAAYDLIDDPALLSIDTEPGRYRRKEKALIEACNCVFVTADTLGDYVREQYPDARIESIPNGVDFDWFSGAARNAAVPEELKGVPRPIAGFTGALYNWRDAPLLLKIARARPQVSFVFVGYREEGDLFDKLTSLPNVHYFREKPYKDIPAWVKCFDACLIPLSAGTMAKFMNPKKLYEYLSLGKPTIISDNLSEIKKFDALVYSASGEEGFLRSLDLALNEADADMVDARISFARANSWSARVEKMEIIIDQSLTKQAKVE